MQSDILRLLAEGLTYREIGRQLHLREPAVKYHMKQILERLHLANRAQAEAYARRSGLGGEAVTVWQAESEPEADVRSPGVSQSSGIGLGNMTQVKDQQGLFQTIQAR